MDRGGGGREVVEEEEEQELLGQVVPLVSIQSSESLRSTRNVNECPEVVGERESVRRV